MFFNLFNSGNRRPSQLIGTLGLISCKYGLVSGSLSLISQFLASVNMALGLKAMV
jgi:hypothetical protein